jgi:hypothetical protein
MALRALLLATQMSATDVHGSLQVMLDGREVKTLNLTASNNDLLHQFVFKDIDTHQPASIRLRFEGAGSLAYQVVGRSSSRGMKNPPPSRFPSTWPTTAPGSRRTI